MKASQPEPVFRTPHDQLSEVEHTKLASNCVRGNLHNDFRDTATDDIVEASETLAKSHGIYLEYNRAKTGREKDWMYMVRISIPGGGSLTREQYRAFDDVADKYTANPNGQPSLRATTRQNIQYHWVKKHAVVDIVSSIAKTGFFSLNGCGDNTRNVMGCPLSKFSDVFNAQALAVKYNEYFRLPAEPHIQVFEIDTSLVRTPEQHFEYAPNLLNRKFKIAFSTVHREPQTGKLYHDNCVELLTNDMGVAPVVENDRVVGYQVFIGGGQGEKNGKPTYAAMGLPLCVFTEENLLPGLDAIVKIHQEWGDRKNRHWARLKYLVRGMGIPWYQQQLRERGAIFEQPVPGFDPGPRMMHHGWHTLPSNGLLAYGAYIENGRIIDGENGRLKTMVRHLLETFDGVELMTTPNQDLLFTHIKPDAKEAFEAEMTRFGFGQRNGKTYSKLRLLSGACVGLDTCRLSYTESEQFEPELVDELDKRGYGDMAESIGITGCERQCFRPGTKSIGLLGQGPNLYAFKLGGTEAARHQGQYLTLDDRWYLRQVKRDRVADVCAALFDLYRTQGANDASMGDMLRRMGPRAIVAYLKATPTTADLMEKTADAPYVPDEYVWTGASETCPGKAALAK